MMSASFDLGRAVQMQHHTTARGTVRRRRLGAVALVATMLVAGCTDGGVTSRQSEQHRDEGTAAASPSGSTPGTAGTAAPGTSPGTSMPSTTSSDDELPALPDVTADEWKPETRTDELAAQIGETPPTPQQAVDAFALLYPDMPGATPSDLPRGDGLDATYTWMLIRSVRDRLAPDQRAAVDAAEAGDELGTIQPDGTSTQTALAGAEIPGVGDPPADSPTEPGAGPTATTGTVATGSSSTPSSGGFVLRRRMAPQTYARYLRLALAAYADMHANRADLPPFTIQLKLSKQAIEYGGMDTGPVAGVAHTCLTTVDPGFVANNYSDAVIKFFFAHEFFHCVQFQWNPTLDWRVAKWVFDGSADFAALDVYRRSFAPEARHLWRQWFLQPQRPLAGRWYDAWPLFETLWEEGTDPYPAIRGMVVGATSADPTADLALGGMDGELFRMKWSSRSYRSSKYPADDWQLTWPGPNAGAGPRENRADRGRRGVGAYDVIGRGAFSQQQLAVTMDDKVGIVDVTPSGGPLTTQSATGVLHVADGSTARLCFAGDGCVCPDADTSSNATPMAGREMVFSFAAAAKATTAHVEARPWDPEKECKRKKPARASSNGDPHLVTLDGKAYDMMTLGEFVTVRDPAGDFEVQTRNVVAPGLAAVGTLTSAVAVRTGRHRVTWTVKDIKAADTLVVRVDGTPTTDDALELDGVAIRAGGTEASLTWPDGTTVALRFHLGWFVTITPSAARAGRVQGLLGAADGDFVDDLRMPDGTIVDPVRASVPDSAFSKAWRVTAASSLFDYDAGQSPDTFNVPYPADPLPRLPDAAAVDRCTRALGPDAVSHEITSCAYDVSVTGDDDYVTPYRTVVQDRVSAEEGGSPPTEPPPPPPSSVAAPTATGTPALTLSGTLVASYSDSAGASSVSSLTGTVAAKSGTVMIFRAQRCTPGVTLFLKVANHDSGESGGLFICDPNDLQLAQKGADDEAVPGEIYLWVGRDGNYDISIDTDGVDPTFVSVDVFVDPQPTIIDGADAAKNGVDATLKGTGDTLVITGDATATFTATGLRSACATEAYGADPVGTDQVWGLAGFCGHDDTVSLPGANVPLVIFARTDDPVEVKLVPQ